MAKEQRPVGGKKRKAFNEHFQERVQGIFSSKEELPASINIQQAEAMAARIKELEAKLGQPGSAISSLSPATAGETLPPSAPPEQLDGSRMDAGDAPALEARRKRLSLWVAGIFTAIAVAFLVLSQYIVYVLQQGARDVSDKGLLPVVIAMVIANLVSWNLIRRNRVAAGAWILYLASIIVPPVLVVLFIGNIYPLMLGYIAAFTAIFVSLILPAESRRRGILVALGAGLVIAGIEVWNPQFRPSTNNIQEFTIFVSVLAFLAILIFSVRQVVVGNIRTKLIVAFSAVALVSVAAIGFITNLVVRRQVTEQAGTTLYTLAQAQSQAVGNDIAKQVELITALQGNPTLGESALAANSTYHGSRAAIDAEINRLDEQWRAADAAGTNADPLVQSVLSNDLAAILTTFQASFPDHIEVFVTDRYGASIASTDRTSDYNQADEEWWQIAYNEGRGATYVGQPEFDQSTQTYAINMAIPVRSGRSATVIGILRTTYRLEALKPMLASVRFGQTGVTDVIFPNGELVGSDVAQETVDPAILAELDAISGPYVQMTYDGVPSFISKVPVAASGPTADYIQNLNWTLVTSQESTEALSPITAATRTILFVSVGVLLVAVLLGVFGAQYLATPISRLTAVAQQVAAGNLAVEAKAGSRDEIGILASTFNSMVAQLRNLIGSLERRVAERTHDLELASEVGRAVSEKTADLYGLLEEAVEMIRERFGLYYTQLYLADPTGRTLILRAGTGEVGAQLIQRSHQLPLGSGSLNGRAAADKRAVIVSDTAASPDFLPNPLLPDTRSEMAVPLLVSGQVVGVLDMQSTQPGSLNETNLPAFETLAAQLAIAIQNAALFAEAQQARAEVEDQVRRLTQEGWQGFLNAVDRNERVGFAFDQAKAVQLKKDELSTAPVEGSLNTPITVSGAEIGTVQVAGEEGQRWTSEDIELVRAASAQLGQHIENLRLLAQAEQYRSEAEQAVRRLTREGWETYGQARQASSAGYSYDLNQVRPLSGDRANGGSDSTVKRPLIVNDETIGELSVDEAAGTEGTAEILTAVAEQLSGHLENLRLSEQNEKRAQEMETVAEVGATSATLLDPDLLLQTVVDLTKTRFGVYHVHVYLADDSWQTLLLASGAGEVGRKMVAEEHTIPLGAEKSLVARSARERQAVIVDDVRADPTFLPNPLLPETRSEMAVPMIVGDKVLGVFDVQSDRTTGFTKEDASIYTTLASQVAVALQNSRLYVEQAATVTQLRELDRLKTSFLANMSHELRTPLNSILGFADVILNELDGPLTENMANDLQLIHKNGQHLLSLINNVLDMAKIEAGKMSLSLEKFKLHDVIQDVVSISAPMVNEVMVALDVEKDSDQETEVEADRIRIRQVMLNLVGNAIKFTDKGEISVRADRQDDHMLIRVHDTGVGIPPDQQERVFQEFTQVDASATRKVGGTGLGLPISKKLVEMHGGRLWVESTGVPGEGSTFFFELPIVAKVTEVVEVQEK